ncbi:hypothetical protein DRO38_04230, partial [Candidatus Bathyarchaeota archaeon]
FLEILKWRITSNPILLKIIIISTLATGITGVPLFFLIKGFSHGDIFTLLIGGMLILTGILLRTQDSKDEGYKRIEDMKIRDMLFLGLAQGFSILPGVSRSGTTITFLLLDRMRQEDTLKVSFLISVPAVLGAVTLNLVTSSGEVIPFSVTNALVMITVAFLAGYATIDLLLRSARHLNFSKFCIILGFLTIVVTVFPWII